MVKGNAATCVRADDAALNEQVQAMLAKAKAWKAPMPAKTPCPCPAPPKASQKSAPAKADAKAGSPAKTPCPVPAPPKALAPKACLKSPPPKACHKSPPPKACHKSPPPQACQKSPPPNVSQKTPPPKACQKSPPEKAAAKGSPPAKKAVMSPPTVHAENITTPQALAPKSRLLVKTADPEMTPARPPRPEITPKSTPIRSPDQKKPRCMASVRLAFDDAEHEPCEAQSAAQPAEPVQPCEGHVKEQSMKKEKTGAAGQADEGGGGRPAGMVPPSWDDQQGDWWGWGGWSWWNNSAYMGRSWPKEEVARSWSWQDQDVPAALAGRSVTRNPLVLEDTKENPELESKPPAPPPAVQEQAEQEQEQPGEEEQQEEADQSWRCDKRGEPLKPGALYMRFLRQMRSTKSPPPQEVLDQARESEKDLPGAKMNHLYEHYLACQGNWARSVLVIRAKKECSSINDEVYSFVRFTDLVSKLGEELALDLKNRLLEQEQKLPASKKGKFIKKHPQFPDREDCWLYRFFVELTDTRRRKESHAAEVSMEAELQGDSAMEVLEKQFEDMEGEGGAGAAKIKKAPKQRTIQQMALQVRKDMKKLASESQLWQDHLKQAGVKPKFTEALIEDATPALDAMEISLNSMESELAKDPIDEAQLQLLVTEGQACIDNVKKQAAIIKKDCATAKTKKAGAKGKAGAKSKANKK